MKIRFLGKSILILCTLYFLRIDIGFSQEKKGFIKRTFESLTSSKSDSSRAGSFMFIPALGYSQESGLEYGLVANYNFYLDKSDEALRTSNINLIGTLTTKKQKKISLVTDLWTKENKYHVIGEVRIRDWPLNFYGIGSNTLLRDEDYIGQKMTRVKLDVERKVVQSFYAGLNVSFENFELEDKEPGGIFENPELIGTSGGKNLSFGASALLDTRNNTTFSTKGFYTRLRYAYSPKFWEGDQNFSGSQLEIDSRYFATISNPISIGIQALYRTNFTQKIPVYMYNDLGGDMTMRGYYLGRYKDQNYVATQAELRFRVHPRIGATLFGGAGSAFSDEHKFRLVESYGAGLRYFFNLEHKSTLRLDYAIGEKRPGEKRQKGFYISVSEAF